MLNAVAMTTEYTDGATHLLIRQIPPSTTNNELGDLCPQSIPVLLQMKEDNDEETAEMAPTEELKTANLEEFMDVVTTYKCKFCPFSCAWKSGLMSHIRNTHIEVGVQKVCGQIEQQFINDENGTLLDNSQSTILLNAALNAQLETNLEQANEKQIFLCGQCNKGFISLDECKDHMIEDHKIPVEGMLNETNKKTKKSKKDSDEVDSEKESVNPAKLLDDDFVINRKRKRNQWVEEKNYRCEECGCKFKIESNLQYHEKCHLPGVKLLSCPECQEKWENWRLLSLHLWKQHNIDAELYACPSCQYKTYSSFKLENHRRIHSEERSFICSTCGKGFKQVSQLRNHSIVHMDRKNMTEKRWYSEQKCDICLRTFSDSKCLRKHLQAVHSKIKPFVCSYCGHTSARKAMLQLHMRQHTGEKPFQCDQCEYRTGDHNSLRRHKMRHTGAKPYKCPHCAYACIQAISYKTHLKNKHPGLDGLFACTICSFRSVSKDNYLNHMADHKRGAIPNKPAAAAVTTAATTSNTAATNSEQGVLPCGNMAAAQIIYSCLNALTNENGIDATSDGTRTFTIQIPADHEMQEDEQYYLAIQGPTDETDLKEANTDTIQTVRLITDSNSETSTLNLPLVITSS